MDFGYLYGSFDGRINRKPYWMATLILIGVIILLAIIGGFIMAGMIGTGAADPTNQALFNLVFLVIFGYPITALMVKRLHDRDKPGTFAAIFWAPTILSTIGQLLGITTTMTELAGEMVPIPTALGWILIVLSIVIGLWALVELGFLRGTPGSSSSASASIRRTSVIAGGAISRWRSFGGDADAAGFVGRIPHLMAWPNAPRNTACTCRIVAGDRPRSFERVA